ncbi:OLC1v1020852C2 [Oldenlandia corymbosa var. corymbosa]|uniref:OLC1v1020852C2 n=1 Tax=Oldenlandia corymbosa var. corymbosa TaxID=529605 RepID=A0AAV1BUD6_OLDCO|nr:OLC1v1020852C2 [Oldenlandia corymbosa var. corymbosa]
MVASIVFTTAACSFHASYTKFCRTPAYLSKHASYLIPLTTSYFPSQTSNVKLHIAPSEASSRSCLSRLAAAGAVRIDGRNRKGDTPAEALIPNDLRRMIDVERQLDGLFSEVKSLISLEKKNDAADLLEANYLAVKDQMDAGFRSIEEAAILDVLALGYMALNDTRTVVSLLDLLNGVVSGLKEEEEFLDSILVHMGNMYEKLEKFELAVDHYRRALEITEKKYGVRSSLLVSPMLGMAKALGSNKKVTEAVTTYQRVIELLEYHKGRLCEELVLPLFALGKLFLSEGRVSEAEIAFERILNIYSRLYGEKDGRVGTALCFLAHVKCATGSVDEAIDLYKDAFRTLKESKFVELDDDLMEKIRLDLAELLHVAGRGEEGRVLLEECMLITEKYQGKDHPRYAIQLINIATSYSQSKKFAEAEHFLRKSLQIMTKTKPPDDQSITYPMLHLAVTLYNLNRDEEAETFALKALHIREKVFGPESLPVGQYCL